MQLRIEGLFSQSLLLEKLPLFTIRPLGKTGGRGVRGLVGYLAAFTNPFQIGSLQLLVCPASAPFQACLRIQRSHPFAQALFLTPQPAKREVLKLMWLQQASNGSFTRCRLTWQQDGYQCMEENPGTHSFIPSGRVSSQKGRGRAAVCESQRKVGPGF